MGIQEILWAGGGTAQVGREKGGGGLKRKGRLFSSRGGENPVYPVHLAAKLYRKVEVPFSLHHLQVGAFVARSRKNPEALVGATVIVFLPLATTGGFVSVSQGSDLAPEPGLDNRSAI